MNIKELHQQLAAVRQRIWRNTQYLGHHQKQLAWIYRATPATGHRTRQRINGIRDAINRDSLHLAALSQSLIAAIDSQENPQIQEILIRRYVGEEPFADIAKAMDYDLRWVYRLHQRGLEGGHQV